MTWIFIPSSCLQASASLAKDCEPGSDTWASRLAPSLTLNGKLTRPQSWRLACKRAAWMQHLCGATSPPSTLDAGLEPWIASLRASRARTCHSQAGAPGWTASAAGCSLRSSALPVIAVRDTSFWRTSQASLLPPPPLWTKPKGLSMSAQPPASWENWPTAGGMRNGSLFQRPTLEPATGGLGGFAGHGEKWTTPQCHDVTERGSGQQPTAKAGNACLARDARQWATPQARDHKNPDKPESGNFQRKLEQGYTIDLNSQAAKWATPDCNTSTYSNGKMGPNIREQAAAFSPQAQPAQPGQELSSTGPTSPRRLNPAFTEWLMGWPTGWTIAAPSVSSAAATALWRRRLHLHLSALCAE